MLPFRIKVCGITSPGDAVLCAEAGADAVGLNFYRASKRYVPLPVAREIIAALPPTTRPVGLFVNEQADTIHRVAREIGLEWIQLHGDETPFTLAEIPPSLSILWARRGVAWSDVAVELDACQQLGRVPEGVLCDARVEGSYGGTGQTADWSHLADRRGSHASFPLLLAGGLNGDNVAEAIRRVQPWGVDTASGVEQSPGIKDPTQVRTFVAQARAALGPIEGSDR